MRIAMMSVDQVSPQSLLYTTEEGTWLADAVHEAACLSSNV